MDESAELVVSNYCFHHLDDAGKERALREVARVLTPGGRLVFGELRFASGTWEQPARAKWWEEALPRCGFIDVQVDVLPHEGGIASARKP